MLPSYEIIVIIFLASFMASLFTGFPIAWILGGLSFVYTIVGIVLFNYFDVDTFFLDEWSDFAIIVDRIWAIMSNWVLVALPMFVFMGLMLDRSGVAERLMHDFTALFGRFNGGLAISVVLIGVLLAASTGIIGASVVLLAVLAMPAMLQAGYARSIASGVVAASGTLGILIPPSIMLVIMADQLGLSVGNLFMGALFPGLILGLLYLLFVVLVGIVRPKMAPKPQNLEPITKALVLDTLISVLPPLVLIVAVLGSIFAGIATPTEASGIGAFGATLLALFNGRLNFKVVQQVAVETALTTAFIFGIFIGATAFALVMRALGGDELIAEALKGLPFGPNGIVLFILFVAFLAGFFLDWLEITLIILPLVAPVVLDLGFELTWFVVLFAVCLQTSFLTPPVGFALFYLKGVAPPEIVTTDVYKGIIPFVLLQVLGIFLVFEFPQIVLWLPEAIYGQ